MVARKRRSSRRGQHEWSAILERFRSSGLTQRAFCAREGVSLTSLQRWRARIDRGVPARFVELTPSPCPRTDDASWTLELSLPGGATIRWRG